MASARAVPTGPPRSDSHRSPTKWLSAYDDFITKNLGQVSQIESTLRSLTYIIPGRFRDAEIASEAIHSGVQLLSLYHDLLLLRIPSPTAASQPATPSDARSSLSSHPPPGLAHPPSQHTRYTRYWTYKSPFYRRVAIVLQVVRYTEMLCEMAAKRRGERIRWRVVVVIEAIKAICQLLLLRITRGRTLVTPVLPVRQPLPEPGEDDVENSGEDDDGEGDDEGDDEGEGEDEEYDVEREDAREEQPTKAAATAVAPDHSHDSNDAKPNASPISPQPPLSPPPSPLRTLAEPVASANLPPSPPPTEHQSTPSLQPPSSHAKGWSMPRTGMSLPPLPQPGDISAYLLSRVLTADDIKPATKLLNQLRGSAQVAEIMHILAPLVFAIALARSREKRRTSWTPWLAGLAMECAARQLRDHSLRTTTLEREEWTRRGWSMGWWSMRGAFYEHIMKGVVGGVRARLPHFVGGIVEDYEYLWENYYFSTSP